MSGKVYLVGAGPGDPELLTLRASRVLATADVVIHDRLVHPGTLALVRPHARLIYAGKEGGGASTPQEEIHQLMVDQARLGRVVVRLKGGDPFMFGRGGEEALALEAAGIAYEVVPGVTSGVAGPMAAGIPVTHRGVSNAVTFATAQLAKGEPDWEHLARSPTLVLFMAGRNTAAVMEKLRRAGLAAHKPVALVEYATWEQQRVLEATVETVGAQVDAATLTGPALLIVGDVVKLRKQLHALVQDAGRELVTHAS